MVKDILFACLVGFLPCCKKEVIPLQIPRDLDDGRRWRDVAKHLYTTILPPLITIKELQI